MKKTLHRSRERAAPSRKAGRVRAGVGGWTFEPWRGAFYPPGLKRKEELAYASRRLTSIEVNGTFYRTQKPESFRQWAAETPDDFMFSIKGPGAVVNRKQLAEAGPALARFFESGPAELGPKLGPILWQFAPSRRFDREDLEAFLALLPSALEGRPLRHAIEPRHESFKDEAFIALLRRFRMAVVYADSADYPAIADLTADFVYARLQRGHDDEPLCYPPADLAAWADRARTWSAGAAPPDLPRVSAEPAEQQPRDCFIYLIRNGKVRAPAGAMALIEALGG
jgi:uncharacterized protein YecE (DUF72 family)